MQAVLRASLFGKAVESGVLTVGLTNPRDFSEDKFKRVDDAPFGGGGGMVLRVDVLTRAWEAVKAQRPHAVTVLLTPQGESLDQVQVCELAGAQELILVCGHYEGIDERFIETCVDREISIGPYVLTGGELPALVLADAVSRWVPGVVGNPESVWTDTFSPKRPQGQVFKHPQYTRPIEFRGHSVPEVLRSGDHQAIARWRKEQSVAKASPHKKSHA